MSAGNSGAVDGAFGFVLAARDQRHGLSFWSNDYGFGPLFNATVYSEADVAASPPINAGDPGEWLAMPAPLGREPGR